VTITRITSDAFERLSLRAKFLGVFEGDEWLEVRRAGIGGSEVATICGLNPWQSAYTLWATKRGLIAPQTESSALEWGKRLEPVVIEKFADSHPELTVFTGVGTWSGVTDWQIVNVDAIFEDPLGELGIFEAKTALYADNWGQSGSGSAGVPAYYRTQVQWYLQALGLKRAIVGVFILGARDYREYEIEADEFEQDMNFKLVEEFKTFYLDAEQEPLFSEPMMSTLETVREMHPLIEDTEVELGALGNAYLHAVTAVELANDVLNTLKAQVLDAMGNAKRGFIDNELAVVRQAKGKGLPYLVNKKKGN